jgi:hypothetical protein
MKEERVERNPVLCEPLNEDIGFFISCVLLYLLVLTLVIYLLIELILFRSSWLGLSLVVLLLLTIILVAL